MNDKAITKERAAAVAGMFASMERKKRLSEAVRRSNELIYASHLADMIWRAELLLVKELEEINNARTLRRKYEKETAAAK